MVCARCDEETEVEVPIGGDGPRRIEVIATGPIASRQSANTVSATTWVYPGKNIVEGVGFLLEMPGLIVQIVDPPTHYAPRVLGQLQVRANVAMMCGCPISPKKNPQDQICPSNEDQPWLPEEFEVKAIIRGTDGFTQEVPLAFTEIPPGDAPGQFTAIWTPPANGGIFEITVYAFQAATGNTGVDIATLVASARKS